jgi:hypothetical protein
MSGKRPDYSKMTKMERCELAESIFIEHPRLKELIAQIQHAQFYSQIAAEPECVFIGGLPGAGKTTLTEHYERLFPRVIHEDRVEVPVLCGRVPSKATDNNLATALLLKLGDPAADKGTAFNRTMRLYGLIRACGVRLIILDEFQHFVDKDSWRVLKNVSDWLKNLIDETGVPIVLIGMPYAVEILDAPGNEQLQRRFAMRSSIEPFGWDTDEERRLFRVFLRNVDDKLPLNERSYLSDPLTAFRFYCATNGRVGKVMKVVRKATEIALDEGLECLTLDALAAAYDERLMADQPERVNPFRSQQENLEVVSSDEPPMNFAAMSRRSRRKAREETASHVLHV